MSVSQRSSAARPLRVDAEQNRARIIEIARDALATDGETTMQAIARAAGVGQGTLYRRFPTREALLAEVYREDFDRLVDAAHSLLTDHSPVVALRAWFDELATFGRKKHALADALDAATRAQLHDEQYDRILAAIAALLDAGAASADLRTDVAPDEVLPLVGFLWQLDGRTDTRTDHLLDLVVDALRLRR
jgi:AcrR family transcriptional regulator